MALPDYPASTDHHRPDTDLVFRSGLTRLSESHLHIPLIVFHLFHQLAILESLRLDIAKSLFLILLVFGVATFEEVDL